MTLPLPGASRVAPSAAPPSLPMCDSSRDSSAPVPAPAPNAGRACPVCATALPGTRARYCSAACRQRAFRLRQVDLTVGDGAAIRRELQQRQALVAHTVYECPTCGERLLGVRRCPDCNVFCRAVGPGGQCPDCERPILLAELLGTEGTERR